jgi:hypothetical protein
MKYLLLIISLLTISCNSKDNWIVVPFEVNGNPFNCYILEDVSIFIGKGFVWWTNKTTHQTTEIQCNFIAIKVQNDNWDEALKEVKLTRDSCNKLHEQMYTPAK